MNPARLNAVHMSQQKLQKDRFSFASGDIIKVYGGIGEQNTFNIEKFQVMELNDVEFVNPVCECGKRMTSAGKNKGFKCKKCGSRN